MQADVAKRYLVGERSARRRSPLGLSTSPTGRQLKTSSKAILLPRDYSQIVWSPSVEEDCRRIIRLAVLEDFGQAYDWTTVSLVPEGRTASAMIAARKPGVIAGLSTTSVVLDEMEIPASLELLVNDGDLVKAGQPLAKLSGEARDLLSSERIILNLLGRLSGIATLTRQYVDAIAGTTAAIYDTRKTTPGWRRLEKYAVYCGGGRNHRLALSDAVLIKDNHLAFGTQQSASERFTIAAAVERSRQFVAEYSAGLGVGEPMIIEVEVDTLQQLRDVLPARPDIVLLDNMSCDQLRDAVAIRNQHAPEVQLEASGGVNLSTVRDIASTGVERISVGALTHSAIALDVGLDWL